jgi:CzcA family heavy metal efflux pump
MFDKLIRWSIESRVLIIIAAIALTATGIFTAMTMPVDVFPDLTAPIVTVMTEANGMAPTEVENLVTFPVEAALNGAAGVRRVRSSSAVGLSIVWVEFQWGTDIYRARQIVTEKLALINEQLPEEVDKPVLTPVSSIMGEIQYISLTTDRHDPIELRTTADNVVRRRLLSVPGVSQVINIGGEVKQYHVVINQERLWSYKISLDDVRTALQHSNKNDSAGFMVKNGTEYIVKGLGRIQSLDDIGNTVVAEVDNVPIKVSDFAEVKIGAKPKRGEGSANGQPAIIIGVQKGPDINTIELSNQIDQVLQEIEVKLPQGMELNGRVFRQADFIEVSIANIEHALRDGTILVILVMLVFLANLRATFITLTAVPLSLMTSVLILNAMGATINSMTLGGMAIAIGALVDDAVIDVENVFRRLRQNQKLPEEKRRPALEVVYKASVEIRKSIVFATFIIVLVFTPIFFLTEMEGKLLNPLGLAYVTSLLASLLVAVTVTPALCFILLPRSKSLARGKELKPVTWLKQQYARLLDFCLNHPWLVISPGIVQLVLALAAISFMGFSFLPKFNEGALTIGAVSIPGTSLEEASKQGKLAEDIILTIPEVRQVARRTGRAELDEHAMGVDSSEIEVSYVLDQGRSKAEFVKEIRDKLSIIPGVGFSVGQPISPSY